MLDGFRSRSRQRFRPGIPRRLERNVQLHIEARRPEIDLGLAAEIVADALVNELHAEAGYKLNGSLVRESLVDELLIYLAPILIGVGREIKALPGALSDVGGHAVKV